MSKHVLITGGAGFIAHHVIDLLIRVTDWKITTIDRLDYSGNLNRLHEVLESYDREVQKRVNVVPLPCSQVFSHQVSVLGFFSQSPDR